MSERNHVVIDCDSSRLSRVFEEREGVWCESRIFDCIGILWRRKTRLKKLEIFVRMFDTEIMLFNLETRCFR